ncbi:hypothetical protein L228DRAFT_283915 [Xylona heveae TC161]|uniref:Uncharacterized protein n=1 Tax=Xylona heveae (strain CBS 132557 / TC161) TaxID=1328760 RepID=A0A165G664_XYLHT|nr:hypothetical protein L228DRAFT_283915 [Xylona heveae TC161]KZF21785.1 hypothetical protein L228DRAFT_283915 [Xylona heveae TC161]
MGHIDIRELLQFPSGDNSSDVLINNVHFNKTALNHYNYTLYSNGTLSNSSKCYLVFDQFQPVMLSNGTFINGTSCYLPYYHIQDRGTLGIVFACLFAVSIMFTMINLRKHGRLFLPKEKRFRAIGRRWQWYWMLFVAACGIISGLTSVDVDRDYLQSLALILTNFFYYLMLPGILAAVWEATRHWGSWQERQIYDSDPYSLPQDDVRSKKEFWMPLMFYLFTWLNFFMVIPRSWSSIQLQRSLEQQNLNAKPAATDARFKAGSILAAVAWLIICYSLRHSIHYYKPRGRGIWQSFNGFFHWAPVKLLLAITILAVRVGYGIASAFDWSISPLKYNVQPGWMFGLGYATTLLIIIIFEIWGYVDENEDRLLIAQRRERGRAHDAELGLVKKPSWWSKLHGGPTLTSDERLRAFGAELGGGQPTRRNIERTLELGNMPTHQADPAENPFRDTPSNENTPRMSTPRQNSNASSNWGGSERTLGAGAPPTKVRSMLDI